ncbi:hypothetical protein Tco_0635985 [Tanacetum coccineum]
MSHPHPKGKFVPKAVLMKSGLKTLNTARQNSSKAAVSVNTARPINTAFPRPTVNCARPASNVFNRAHSHVKRPFNKFTTNKNSNFNEKVNTGNPQQELKDKGVIDSECSRHMTGNRSYLTDYKEIDGGFVAFGGSTKGGKITGKGRKPALSFMRPFGCPVTILNTIDHLDALTKSMNYKPVVAGNQSNGNAGTKACDDAGKARMETVPGKDYILLPMWPADPLFSQNLKDSPDAGFKPLREEEKIDTKDLGNENAASGKDSEVPSTEEPREDQRVNQELDASINNTNNINTASDGNNTNNVNAVSSTVNAAVTEVNAVDPKTSIELPNDPNMPELEDIVYSDDDEDVGAEADMNNLDAFMPVSPIPTTRIHKDHPVEQIIRDLNSAPETRRMTKNLKEHGLFSSVEQRTNHKDFQNYLFACFLSQEEPKKLIQALKDPS